MDNESFQGDLAETPFYRILAAIGKEERSGTLHVSGQGSEERSFCIDKGSLAVERSAADDPGFLASLAGLGLAGQADLDRCLAVSSESGTGILRILVEERILSASRLWSFAEDFVKSRIYPLFNRPEGGFRFEPGQTSPETLLVRGIPLTNIILEGIRRMNNFAVIEASLPGPGESVQALSARAADHLDLAPHEKYVLNAAPAAVNLETLYRTSALGEREAKRCLLAHLVLGTLAVAQPKGKNSRPAPEITTGEVDRLFAVFNDKCSYIFKYISKEIGPVAHNVIEKSVDELQGKLDPAFQGCEVKPDGRIELRALLKRTVGALSDEARKSILRSFDEILASEVLAVKRTLGNRHEAVLVRGLEKIGDLH
ncbi:MAG: DUF4388 domain-containing protein [Candidatus Aminicenantales bacterium]